MFILFFLTFLLGVTALTPSVKSVTGRASVEKLLKPQQPLTAEEIEAKKKAEEARFEEALREQGLKWSYSESEDQMGRGKVKAAYVRSLNQISFDFPYRGPQRATLTLRSHPKHGKDVILSIERGQFITGIGGTEVSVRFGSGKAQTFQANGPADHGTTSLFLEGFDRFTGAAKKSDKISIEAQFFQEGSRVFEFDSSGLEWR